MPKLKSKKGVTKRFKVTGSGKVKRSKAGKRHLLTSKTGKRKRTLRKGVMTDKTQEKSIKEMMPYS